jgi:SAM-dependent methyltransferase
MSNTFTYYNDNAERFFAETVEVNMSDLHIRFLTRLPQGGLILDAGCGSGRDSKAFLERGYRVNAFDASPALAKLAAKFIGQEVAARTFDQVDEAACYDGVWACASLLHLGHCSGFGPPSSPTARFT